MTLYMCQSLSRDTYVHKVIVVILLFFPSIELNHPGARNVCNLITVFPPTSKSLQPIDLQRKDQYYGYRRTVSIVTMNHWAE